MGVTKRTEMNKGKIGQLIKSYEENIKLKEDDPIRSEIKKKKLDNAFTKLLESKGGDTTPSPGRKKRKRLGKVKPHGVMKLDNWLVKE